MHQNLIFNAAGRIGRQLNIFLRIKGVNSLNQANGSDRNQIFHPYAGVVKLFCYVNHQTQIMFNQSGTGFFVPLIVESCNEFCFFSGIQRRRQNVSTSYVMDFSLFLHQKRPKTRCCFKLETTGC